MFIHINIVYGPSSAAVGCEGSRNDECDTLSRGVVGGDHGTYYRAGAGTAPRWHRVIPQSHQLGRLKMRFKILATAVMVSTVGISATTASAAHHKVAVGHRHSTPAPVVAQASNWQSAVAMPLPLRPAAPRPKPSGSAQSKSGAGPRTASGAAGTSGAPAAAGTGGAPAAVGTGGRADRSGGRAASF
jgi:hypothetical protein